ncbi:LacI family DNA-binding transcriptional regulator [Sphingomonas koreensis]|uniref:LacI family DNA-binding transcriptional regulator n=1 Tax=Sphingomonas koreensis TaxID=93064 RepID=UPI00083651B2|nr:LacI family DNA-binding transcriptional regulator [Sphingomonas koreensis]PJI88602.1 transcriptional regulator, LacI family [Sphingomonas koreensis]RSU58819.1 LacI family DNA-binding transcriptional regulator [Sphingomonas koreensis]RSU67184.1 LacI family DNA-binding transcriptional regulator [Sphingomonas koreensis]
MSRSTRKTMGGVTVQDVARAAGVSAMTVSRVMNGGTNVRADTRKAVLAAVDQLDYRPNAAARSLAAGGIAQIGLLYANPSAGYLSQFLIGALETARRAGSHLVLEACEDDSPQAEAEAVRQLIDARVRGVVLPPPLSESAVVRTALAQAGIPWAAIAMGSQEAGTLNVRIDDFEAARAITRHLIELGHREIGFIRGHPNQVASAERHRGFVAALEEAGIDPASARIEQGLFTYRSGIDAAERILAASGAPTAIFASNDDMAAAAVGVAHRHGLHVPGDLSIVGFDDTAIATSIWPALTTIRQPISAMAEAAITMLLRRLRERPGEAEATEEEVLPYELVLRESAGPRTR